MPERLEVTIDSVGGACPPWAKPPVPESVWREAVGVRIADRARAVELDRDVLVVRVATNVWASELSLLSEQIAARLRERGIRVKSLRFRVGPVDRLGGTPDRMRTRAAPRPLALPKDLETVIATVEDESLRELITNAASVNLAWQANVAPGRVTEAPRAARAPRYAETGTDRPDRTSEAEPEASPRNPGAWPGRRS
jgi:predicted nucleic acid-binding Zn ribbon protein